MRELLRMVAAEMARLQEREKFLEREVRTAQRSGPAMAAALDEEVVTRMLGEEAARILSTAREAGTQIKARAEESAGRVLREGSDEAQRLREEAEVESARRRQDASSDAEAELQMAKQQGREMVNEARAYRERVLSELARRRELARQQIEQLVHGRDRLLQAFERARLSAVDVMAELTPLGEPAEYVNLSPTTGPVPVMLPADHRSTVEVTEIHDLDQTLADETTVLQRSAQGEESGPGAVTQIELESEPEADQANVVSLFAGEVAQPPVEVDMHSAAADEAIASVDDLFARLRASRAGGVAARASEPVESVTEPVTESVTTGELTIVGDDLSVFQPSPQAPDVEAFVDDTVFGRRDAALTPLIVASARKLKRVLADEQNDVLNTLRRKDPVLSLDTLLPWEADHAERYAAAIGEELEAAAKAGMASMGRKRSLGKAKADVLRPAVGSLTTAMIVPLRERLDRAIGDASGDNGDLATTVRSVYREWKTQRIDEQLDDVLRMAFGRGALAGVAAGTMVSWIVDPNGPACPDAEDNALAGAVAAGDAFPTDHKCAPAHSGCRCMLAPVEG